MGIFDALLGASQGFNQAMQAYDQDQMREKARRDEMNRWAMNLAMQLGDRQGFAGAAGAVPGMPALDGTTFFNRQEAQQQQAAALNALQQDQAKEGIAASQDQRKLARQQFDWTKLHGEQELALMKQKFQEDVRQFGIKVALERWEAQQRNALGWFGARSEDQYRRGNLAVDQGKLALEKKKMDMPGGGGNLQAKRGIGQDGKTYWFEFSPKTGKWENSGVLAPLDNPLAQMLGGGDAGLPGAAPTAATPAPAATSSWDFSGWFGSGSGNAPAAPALPSVNPHMPAPWATPSPAAPASPAPAKASTPGGYVPRPSATPKVRAAAGTGHWGPEVDNAGRRFDIDPALIAAVMAAESGGRSGAVSPVGALGLMQLMPGTAAGLGVNPRDDRGNIEGGAKYLRQMLDAFGGNLTNAVAAYNAGPGAVVKYGGVPPYEETQAYVKRVMERYQQLAGPGPTRAGAAVKAAGKIKGGPSKRVQDMAGY